MRGEKKLKAKASSAGRLTTPCYMSSTPRVIWPRRMLNPLTILPASLIDPAQKTAAINYLIASPYESVWKIRVAKGWSEVTGVKFTPNELDRIDASGIDTRTVRGS